MAKRFYDMMGVSAKQEDADGDMIKSDYKAPYNMPMEVKMKNYPEMDYLSYPSYADDYKEKDKQTNRMVKKAKSHMGEGY